ncbi:DUF489 family protein [Succinimonas amylolytica]|uniref:DUF489 family protein n=1 Tax=Succinimonas amylolytica TaxID=83769 RepID=UPI00036FD098|nr:DUF489 family protein [Succinimonas amylolytica]
MADNIAVQALALAAVSQGAAIIQQISRFGTWDQDRSEEAPLALLRALRVENPGTAYDVYPDRDMVLGYQTFVDAFSVSGGSEKQEMELAKYILTFLSLGTKVFYDSAMLNSIDRELHSLDAVYFAGEEPRDIQDEYVKGLAELYKKLISSCPYGKIMIYGNEEYLKQEKIQQRIRALLLAVVRAVILWRQLGGSRLRLFFRRRRIMDYMADHVQRI